MTLIWHNMDYKDQIGASLRILAAQYRGLCQTVIDTAASYGGEWQERHIQVVLDILRGIPVPVMQPPADWETYDQGAYREAYRITRKPDYSLIREEYERMAKELKK